MAEFQDVMAQFDRMCRYYQRNLKCPMGCPMNGVNISQCRKIAFEQPYITEKTVMSWTEPGFPTWGEWFVEHGDLVEGWQNATNAAWMANTALSVFMKPIPADIAEKLGLEPKEKT